ncbi:MAG TPA: acylphosphatase, partial [Candidatus Wallbacteria bacterium]|nr:acylphosphatase [Candidatus Wallbacteria bacterium]
NINGFARNMLNGDVEVYAEGDEKDLSEFVSRVRVGPRHALVTRVTESKTPIISAVFRSFEILEDE